MKFRKKPVVIEAEQFKMTEQMAIDFAAQSPLMFIEWPIQHDENGYFLTIPTLEGSHRASDGDWIITGVNGEKYPCKPDIFAKTYEPAGELLDNILPTETPPLP